MIGHHAGTSLLAAPNRTPIIEMGSMMPERLAGDTVASLVAEMMSDNRRERFFQYAYGNDRFYQEAAQTLLGWAGVTVERPVLFSNGGQNALTAILAALFRPGDRITVKALQPTRMMFLGGDALEGPRHIWWNFVSSRKDRIERQQDFLDTFVDQPLLFAPGEGLEYSNGGPVILDLLEFCASAVGKCARARRVLPLRPTKLPFVQRVPKKKE